MIRPIFQFSRKFILSKYCQIFIKKKNNKMVLIQSKNHRFYTDQVNFEYCSSKFNTDLAIINFQIQNISKL